MLLTYSLSQKIINSKNQICLSFTPKIQSDQVFYFKTQLYIDKKEWDPEKQRPKNIYCKKFKQLNTKLNAIKVALGELIQNQKTKEKIPSSRTITTLIKQVCSNNHHCYPENSLLNIMSQYLEIKKENICLSTYRRYLVFLKLMEKFEGYINQHIMLEEINTQFINTFYVFGKSEQYTESTLKRTVEFVKTILHFAERKGIRTEVRNLEIPKTKTPRRVITLNEKEIKKITQTKVPRELRQAKDWLLISCYTGQRISDFMRFDHKQIIQIDGKPCISFIQQKTGKEITLPLHPLVLKVIKKNGNTFPQPMDKCLYNEHIKKIAELAGIKEPVKARKRAGFRTKDVQVEKWQNISSHIGRRSFASNFYGKIPTPLLMQATGHSTEKMFLNYINPVNHERVITLSKYFDKMYTEKL
ncbi:site-specific integrase [Chryseobacterium nematophagum]|uniref:Site-specific integrase n=1 Tax=Chryseobacterium nematophagum TaxID=2305228 RepID=A0A3M7TF81_9FLAO|nr:site-specific integrase [Chryseobacterium nematophagum]RNA61547.1 site-specific integrase [Chryseobacterium nematophagum]